MLNKVCVYCGSSNGLNANYNEAAKELASCMYENRIELVYGGGRPGLMGIVADTLLQLGGNATGVITRYLNDRGLGHDGLTNLYITESMHERKALMAHLSDGFIALPGGLGTLEEIMEMISWAQLGLHKKPCGLLNINNFYTSFSQFLDHTVDEGFVSPEHRSLVIVKNNAEDLVSEFNNFINTRN